MSLRTSPAGTAARDVWRAPGPNRLVILRGDDEASYDDRLAQEIRPGDRVAVRTDDAAN